MEIRIIGCDFSYHPETATVEFTINNCPFKELVAEHNNSICHTHLVFLQGLFEEMFEGVKLKELNNMANGCEKCTYHAIVTN